MAIELLVASLLPVIAFVLIEWKYGPRAGVMSALGLTMCLLAYLHFRFGVLDKLYIVEFGLLFCLGVVSLTKNNSLFFKFQPAIVGSVVALYIFSLHLSGGSLFERMLPIMEALSPEQAEVFREPRMQAMLKGVALNLGFTFLAYAALVGYAAIYWNSRRWLIVRLAIYPVMFFVMIVSMALHR